MLYTVLVVDDQWSMQELARIVLQSAGYRVLLASDAATGLSLSRLEHPDIIVLDKQLPGKAGLDLLSELRHDPRTMCIPVLFISTEAVRARFAPELRTGTISTLHKPFHPPALLAAVKRILKRQAMPVAV